MSGKQKEQLKLLFKPKMLGKKTLIFILSEDIKP